MAKKKNVVDATDDINSTVDQLNKKFGDGSVMIGRNPNIVQCPSISTGALTLDKALGVWGIPRGRIVEIYGPESSGKTTLTLSIIANAQKQGIRCAFIDAEHALDPDWAIRVGVNMEDLLISQPDYGEQGLEIAEKLGETGKVGLIVIDSVAALTPRAELEGEMGDSHVGLQARMMSQGLRKITGIVNKSDTTVIFINQIREKIGVLYGSPETQPGGRALKFYSSVRLDIRRKTTIKEGDVSKGNTVKVKVVKNKIAPPFTSGEFNIMFGDPVSGIDFADSMINVAESAGVLTRTGSWYAYGETRVGNGKLAAAKYIRDNKDFADQLAKDIRDKYKLSPGSVSAVDDEFVINNEDDDEQSTI